MSSLLSIVGLGIFVGCELEVLVNLKECEKYSLLVNEEIGIDKTVVCLRFD